MTVKPTIDPVVWLRNQLDGDDADRDLLAGMLKALAETLMSAEASAMCGAEYGERTEERVNSRNGYRERRWDTRAGTIKLAVPNSAKAPTSRSGCCATGAALNKPS